MVSAQSPCHGNGRAFIKTNELWSPGILLSIHHKSLYISIIQVDTELVEAALDYNSFDFEASPATLSHEMDVGR